jgi:hypothetical protein
MKMKNKKSFKTAGENSMQDGSETVLKLDLNAGKGGS